MRTTQNSIPDCDVAVIGGGPAGAALATFLARRGHRCLIFEQSKFPRYHIGESLIPHTYGAFDRLGLLPKLKASHFPVKRSVRFVSRNGKESSPFYFSETIPGEGAQTWQVERSEFDQLLLEHAQQNGATIIQPVKVQNVILEDGRAVGVCVLRNGQPETIRARVTVDASGRATVIGRQLGLKREVPGLNKASVWSYYRGGKRLPGIDAGETTIFAITQGGWFWYIPLPDDVVSVGIVASPEYLFAASQEPETIFPRQVCQCLPLAERLLDATQIGPVRMIEKLAYWNSATCGDGWVMIGDARAFLDPIYSSGLFLALASAELAAECIHDALQARDLTSRRLGRFEPGLWAGVEVIRGLIHAFYDPHFSFAEFVRRFPEQRPALIDCLVGDVLKDMSLFKRALEQMTPPPPPLNATQI